MNEVSDVTVIIPAYNCAETIERAIDSIAAQTLMPYQVIIVNDNSTDATSSVLDRILAKKFSFELLILDNKENLGPGISRNLGWDTATTKWIAFLDADDAWHPKKLELQLFAISKNPALDLVCTQSYFVKKNVPIPKIVDSCVTTRIRFSHLLFRNSIKTRSVFMRRDISNRFERGLSEDYRLWLNCLNSGMSFARLESPLTFHFKEEYGQSGLSSRIFTHEYFELKTLLSFTLDSPVLVVCAIIFSIVKFIRRFCVVLVRKAFR